MLLTSKDSELHVEQISSLISMLHLLDYGKVCFEQIRSDGRVAWNWLRKSREGRSSETGIRKIFLSHRQLRLRHFDGRQGHQRSSLLMIISSCF